MLMMVQDISRLIKVILKEMESNQNNQMWSNHIKYHQITTKQIYPGSFPAFSRKSSFLLGDNSPEPRWTFSGVRSPHSNQANHCSHYIYNDIILYILKYIIYIYIYCFLLWCCILMRMGHKWTYYMFIEWHINVSVR